MSIDLSITLVQCPCWGRETPPLAISLLAGNLRSNGYKVYPFDFNNDFYHIVSEKQKRYWLQEEYTFWTSEASVTELINQYDGEIEAMARRISETGSQLVGFSVVFTAVHFTLEIAKRLKKRSPDKIIVLGGPSTAEYAGGLDLLQNPEVDAIVLREGDETLPAICRDLEEKGYFIKTSGLAFKKNGETINGGLREPVHSLDAIPFADYSDFALSRYASPQRLDLFSSRGCLNKCYFCDERKYFQRFRCRSGESLFEEVKYHLSKFPKIKSVVFSDSVINGSLKSLRKFSELLLQNNLKIAWGGQAIIRKDIDFGLLNLMAKAGCKFLSYGIESGSPAVLKSMNKLFAIDLAEQVLKNTHNAGINTYTNFMFGYPTETEEDFLMTLNFIQRNRQWIDGVSPSQSFTVIVPNTYLYDNLEEFGVESKPHHLYWNTRDGENTYPLRFSRYERFCKLCLNLRLNGVGIVEEKIDKWRLLGDYYRYKKDYAKAPECYFKDIIKRGYSPESIESFLECCRQGRKIDYAHPFKGMDKNFLTSKMKDSLSKHMRRKKAVQNQLIDSSPLAVSIIIPNYNGRGLLLECLPSVIAALSKAPPGSEIIVVDDASKDDSVRVLSKEFSQVKVIPLQGNRGFGDVCNIGVSSAKNRIIVLLNSDVMVKDDFLFKLTKHFVDPEVFAVQAKMLQWDGARLNAGMNIGKMERGFIRIWNEAETKNKKQVNVRSPNLYAIGAAMAIDKEKWNLLGGFDLLYRPFCWEDIDICYRALKRGWKVGYEPESIVYHKHHETLKRFFTPNFRKVTELKNSLLFTWKNIHERKLILKHFLFVFLKLLKASLVGDFIFVKAFFKAATQSMEVYSKRKAELTLSVLSDPELLEQCLLYYNNFLKGDEK